MLLKAMVKGLWLFIVVVIALMIIANIYWYHEQKYPTTEDAVLFNRVIPISSRTSGVITNVAVEPDQYVKKDQILFSIDDRQAKFDLQEAQTNLLIANQTLEEYRANLLAAQQNLIKLTSAFNLQQTQYNRLTTLSAQQAVSQSEVDQTKQALEVAKTQYQIGVSSLKVAESKVGEPGKNIEVQKAELAVQQAELNLAYCQVKAPESGYLTNFNLTAGQSVQANNVLFGISNSAQWYIHANILESFLKNVEVGQPVIFHTKINPSQDYQGVVSGVGRGISIAGWQAEQALPVAPETFQWISVDKRFPIMIKVTSNADNHQFRFGASVELTIDTTKKIKGNS